MVVVHSVLRDVDLTRGEVCSTSGMDEGRSLSEALIRVPKALVSEIEGDNLVGQRWGDEVDIESDSDE